MSVGRRITENVTAYTSADSPFVPKGKVILVADDPWAPPTRLEMETARDLVMLDVLPVRAREGEQ